MYVRHTGVVTEVLKKQGDNWCITVKASHFLLDRYIDFKKQPVIRGAKVEEGMKVYRGDRIR